MTHSPPRWLSHPAKALDRDVGEAARSRQAQLTKPAGSLGQLESLAVRLAAMQGRHRPRVDDVHIVVFAADHGVAEEGVSAFPQEVTVEMVRNFSRGGAAISVLARELGATLDVVNVGTIQDAGTLADVQDRRIAPGTCNFTQTAAMTEAQLFAALDIGYESAAQHTRAGIDLFIGGEMGIANTTAATAIAAALLALPVEEIAGPGTGLDTEGVARKCEVIRRALVLHREGLTTPLDTLRSVGGFEIVALTGAYIACAQHGVPVVVDGFIASVAALAATRICSGAGDWLVVAHCSAEPGHRQVWQALEHQPLLDLEMRLGEASGAAVTVPLLRLACALHNGMATFAEASVSRQG